MLRSLTPFLTEVDRIFDHLILNNGKPLVGEGEDCPYGAVEVHISVAKVAYERNPVYGWHPSNPEDVQRGACRALVWRRIEGNEMALASP
ncbi:hypothetical protein K503DRAFT_772628 [Rhizopogon vinicolor AM-OR11-026]|uniref:Uncharacterized protein n=1 Tax=Rhizopogon vinicolor AM-OR11-026 TaxID=1314800 RepID=A0A1B7MUS5_9AGAM|nr:hypothetical protein K503DRAFT_772628 [Rhizopogon vinicolor AM-OR11-026]